jgi:hypothetical protein
MAVTLPHLELYLLVEELAGILILMALQEVAGAVAPLLQLHLLWEEKE